MAKQENFERIEKYLDGEMPFAERQAMDKEMAADTDLQFEFGQHQMAREAMEVMIEDNLRNSFSEWDQEGEKSAKVVSINRGVKMRTLYRRIAIAASFLLLAVVGIGFLQSGQYSNEQLSQTYYGTIDLDELRSIGKNELTDNFSKGIAALSDGKVNDALFLLEPIPNTNDRFEEAQYLIGHANMQLKKYDAAIIAFKNVANGTDETFKMKGEWNLILAKLNADQLDDNFHNLLTTIAAETDHDKNKEANQLKADLEGFLRKVFH